MSGNEGKERLYTKSTAISSHTLPETNFITHGSATSNRSIASSTNISDRPGFNRHDYDRGRPNEKLPTSHADIILACQSVYRKIGVIRNIIDLMTDFASEGLELQHPIKSQERFFRAWAKKVNLKSRAHDFMKLLLRDANVIVRRKEARITIPLAKQMSSADYKADGTGGITTIYGPTPSIDLVDETRVPEKPEKQDIDKKKVQQRTIPWKYTFLSPVMVMKIGGEVGRFYGADSLALRLPKTLATRIKSPKTKAERDIVEKLPAEVIKAAKNGTNLVGLDMDKIYVDYYKKDDWEDWGTPFLYGVLEDIMLKEKMRLADMAALDGVINVIRLWKLGKSDQQILPTSAAVDRLINVLNNNPGGGVMDLVWDDMIDLQVEYPPTDKILGAEKYKAVNADIIKGMGIPESLIGGTDLGTRNAQSAFVQLKTLVEKLEYVRDKAIGWIEGEMRLVAQAMGYKKIPSINFGIMALRDEAAEKQLIIQLLDRGIVSAEKVSEVFGTNFMIEIERLKVEQDIREKNPGVIEKAGPYYRPISVMEKQNELAIELEDAKSSNRGGDNGGGGENLKGDQPTNDGKNSPGRPPSTKDTNPRDERTSKTMSAMTAIGDKFMDEIDKLFDPEFLKQHNAKNIRCLTKEQRSKLEGTKRLILSVLRPGDTVDMSLISERLQDRKNICSDVEKGFSNCVEVFRNATKSEPSAKDRRLLMVLNWSESMSLRGA